jgi:predicted  nucleic acid-binding Zn-ribbon protein
MTKQAQKPTTLEAYHRQKLQGFKEKKDEVTTLRSHLEELIKAREGLTQLSDEWRQLTDEIDRLSKEIERTDHDESRIDYFLSVGPMIFDYYDAQESVASGTNVNSSVTRMPSNSVLSYFAVNEAVSIKKVQIDTGKSRASDLDSSSGLNRDKMLEKYLAVVDPMSIKSGVLPGSGMEPGWGTCPACEVEMTFYQNEAKLGCPECGHEEFILVDSEKPSYKDPPREITYFAYKKINHFNEWLAQFQAKENTDIPQDVIDAVLGEIKKERIRDPKRVKKEKIHQILQKLKLSKMYDHVQQIKNRIQQQMTTLVLSRENEERLQFMFKEIQPAFIKYCPKGRSNFLSYPYVLSKLCQLLEMDEFLPCFQLLKSREKLYQQDQVWEKICTEMNWQFIKSI